MRQLAITWKRSLIGAKEGQRQAIRGLGLRRLGQTVVRADTPTVRGLVDRVRHLVEVRVTGEGEG